MSQTGKSYASRHATRQPSSVQAEQKKGRFFHKAENTSNTFFQAKLQVNQINDPYEQEADRVSEEVTQSIQSKDKGGFFPPPPSINGGISTTQQAKFFQRKPAFESPTELDQNTAGPESIQRTAISTVSPDSFVQRQEKSDQYNVEENDSTESTSTEIVQREKSASSSESPAVDSQFENKLSASKGGGTPLPEQTKGQMESAFGSDFSKVRVHTDSDAQQMNNQVGAKAFTHGGDIYFNENQYQPDSPGGQKLLAHELTHVVQQGHASSDSVQRSARVSERTSTSFIQRLGISDVLDFFAEQANLIPGFAMLTVIIGFNPINMKDVERNAANIFRGIMGFLPGGDLIWRALNNHGIFTKVGDWIVKQLDTLGDIGSELVSSIKRFVKSLSFSDVFNLDDVWDRAKRIFTSPIKRIISFVKGLVKDILQFIRDAVLKPLAALASKTRAWDLLIAVLGRNPITGEAVPRTADTLIGGFMKLIGQEEIWENMKKANAVGRAWAWFQGVLSQVMGFVKQIPSLFMKALKSLEIIDLVLVPRIFIKVGKVFSGFVVNFVSWAGKAMWELLKIIFEVVAPGAMPYLKKASGAFKTILANPVGFLSNLVKAGKLGFQKFASNFLTHLKDGLIGWLTGAMAGAGVYIPQALEFKEILKFILSVLGLTWENLRMKLVKHLGEGPVVALEKGFSLVKTLVTEGPAAAWQQFLAELGNLQEMVIGEVVKFVTTKIVQAAITKLLSALSPVGAFVQAILGIYNTIMFFVERISQIMQVAMKVIDSIAAIAAGVVQPAAIKVEQTLKGLLTLAISFLARIAGLGKVSTVISNLLKKVRAPIDKALDKVILWIKKKAKGFLKKKDNNKHAQIGSEIKKKLTKPPSSNKMPFKDFYKEKVAEAKNLEAQYQPKLEKGVKLTISYGSLAQEEKDKDIDIVIKIAPNTYTSTAEIPHGGEDKDKIDPHTVNFNDPGEKFDRDEYYGQLKGQKQGLNGMTVETFLNNRFAFLKKQKTDPKKSGRHKDSSKFQRQARKDEINRRGRIYMREFLPELMEQAEKHIQKNNLTGEEAEAFREKKRTRAFNKGREKAKLELKGKAALHDPDQVAGGKPQIDSGRFGDARVNSSIGSQWKNNIKPLHAHAEKEFAKLSTKSRDKAKMNVEIPGT